MEGKSIRNMQKEGKGVPKKRARQTSLKSQHSDEISGQTAEIAANQRVSVLTYCTISLTYRLIPVLVTFLSVQLNNSGAATAA